MIARLMLLVGGDAILAARCEHASERLPVIRAANVSLAIDFARTMGPALIVVAPDVSATDRVEIDSMADHLGVATIELSSADEDALAVLREGVAKALAAPPFAVA